MYCHMVKHYVTNSVHARYNIIFIIREKKAKETFHCQQNSVQCIVFS